MTAPSKPTQSFSKHIRKLAINRDLDQIADLIELCFPIHLDQDGQTYIKEMRQAARDMRLVGWLSSIAEIGDQKVAGFVWEEDGRIVGNLSLVPFMQGGRRFHLIANVAVHPDFRRHGIARALTQHALFFLGQQKERIVWLQVRDDNPAAIDLYRSVGFTDHYARTTWRIRPFERCKADDATETGVKTRRRTKGDWAQQKKWLDEAYPLGIRWNLPVDLRRFEPGALQSLANLLDGAHFKHWAFEVDRKCQGVITWQKTSSFANNLWLAFPKESEEAILPGALSVVLRQVSMRHPLSIDYPSGRSKTIFEALGFTEFRTLIWMNHRLN